MHRFLPRAILTVLLLCAALPCHSKSYYVPGDASTIQGGIDLCAGGDTVLVFPGTYTENITLDDQLISIISSGGPETTTIQPADPNISTFSIVGLKTARDASDITPEGEISGFTITGGGNAPTIDIICSGRLIIEDNIIRDNIPEKITDKAVILCHGDSTELVIARNIFYGNYGVTCIQVWAGSAAITNNTFDGNRSAVLSSSAMVEAVNNIVVNSSGTALDGAFLRLDYNDVWNNIIGYGWGCDIGPNDFSLDPQFAGPATHDYSLLESSPCIDAGDPDSGYVDPDGTRNDVGAVPFLQPTYLCGDSDLDSAINVGDAVYLINYIFKSGSAPDPLCLGDPNGDGPVNIGDAVYLIAYIFTGGPPPVDPCCP